MTFSEKQLEYLSGANHRWNVKVGAVRSGKTYVDFFVIPRRVRACREGLIVLLGNTESTLERNILEPMRKLWGERLVSTISANNSVTLFGRKCYALGAGNASQASKLQGSSIGYCYGDEITTWSEEVFSMLKSRLDRPGSVFDGSCNPASPRHWFRQFLGSGADIFEVDFTIDDNPALPPGFADTLKAEYAGTVYYDRYILGRWTAADGAIYRRVCENPDQVRLGSVPSSSAEGATVSVGVDFGGNRSATAFVAALILPPGAGMPAAPPPARLPDKSGAASASVPPTERRSLIGEAELRARGAAAISDRRGVRTGTAAAPGSPLSVPARENFPGVVVLAAERHAEELDPEGLNAAFIAFADKILSRYGRIDAVRCDNAEPVLMRGLRMAADAAGLPLRILPALKSPVNDRIRFTLCLLSRRRLLILPEGETLLSALSEAMWDGRGASEGAADRRLDDGSTDIDTLDAFEYAVEHSMRK